MAWIYLAESADSHWPCTTGLSPLPIVKATDTHKAFCSQECEADNCQSHLSGTMCARYPERAYWNQLMSSREAFLARTLVWRELEKAWAESEVGFSLKLSGLQKKLHRVLYFSKTFQPLELEAFERWSEHLPIYGMSVDGHVYLPQKLAPSTFVNDGSYLPTPTACDYGKNNGRNSPQAKDRWSLTVRARRGTLPGHPAGRLNPEWIEQAMIYPIAWSAIEPWAMQWFRSKRKKRSCA